MYLLLLVVGICPPETVAYDEVDVIEQNMFYDECGRYVFGQIIFWRWDGDDHRVVAWRMLKSPRQLPTYSFSSQTTHPWVSVWMDSDILRCVRARSFRRKWEMHDPEMRDRQELPPAKRSGLLLEKLEER